MNTCILQLMFLKESEPISHEEIFGSGQYLMADSLQTKIYEGCGSAPARLLVAVVGTLLYVNLESTQFCHIFLP